MNTAQTIDPQSLPLEDQLLGIKAKTAPYRAARSWSGGRRWILGKGALDSYTYHVISRTCGGEVFFDDEWRSPPPGRGGQHSGQRRSIRLR